MAKKDNYFFGFLIYLQFSNGTGKTYSRNDCACNITRKHGRGGRALHKNIFLIRGGYYTPIKDLVKPSYGVVLGSYRNGYFTFIYKYICVIHKKLFKRYKVQDTIRQLANQTIHRLVNQIPNFKNAFFALCVSFNFQTNLSMKDPIAIVPDGVLSFP